MLEEKPEMVAEMIKMAAYRMGKSN
jgi:hypothetical protein